VSHSLKYWEIIADINGFLRMHVYEVRPRKDKRGVDLISDALPPRLRTR
jgi:hypothetical protein